MKLRTFVQCVAAIAILTLAWVMWPAAKPRSAERPDQSPATTAVIERPGSLPPMAATSPLADSLRSRRMAGPSRQTAPHPGETRVDTAKVLAMVNQTPLQLRDLMPVRPGETERELTPEVYASRLQRAIEMELTFQAARAQGVELTEAQQQRLEEIAGQNQADLEHYKQYGLTWSSSSAEQVEFEQRVLAAQMLEQNLAAKYAGVVPSPDPEVQSRYERARSEMLNQIEAGANITKAVPAL